MPSNLPLNTPRVPLRILVVEDSEFLRQVLLEALSAYRIEVAADYKEGWQKYVDFHPDLVFLDIGLPDGNGHDLAYRIRTDNKSVYLVMATASELSGDREEALFNRVDDYITKPFDKQKLDDVIERCRTTHRHRD